MFKKMILLICVFTTFQTLSQNALQELKAVIKTLDYVKFTNYSNQLSDTYSDNYFAHAQWRVEQDIFYGYRETFVQIEESYLENALEEKYGRNLFDVRIISHCDTIIFHEIVRRTSNKDENNIWIWTETIEATQTDLKRYRKFISNYEEVFHAAFNIEDLFIEDIHSIYGFYCGMGGGLISLRKELNNYVETKDTVALMNWLSCAKPILQLYAIDGILTLKEQGINFETYVYDIIQIISIKEGYVLSCSGCEVMPYAINVIAEAILKRHDFKF